MNTEKRRNKRVERGVAIAATVVCSLQLLLLLCSWLITAAWPEVALRSLLSSEGIRWLFGKLPLEVAESGIVSLLLLCMAAGALRRSGLADGLRHARRTDYRSRMALRVVACEAVLIAAGLLFLTALPHAILLSVSGEVFPSGFSQNIVVTLSFALILLSLTYGLACGRQHDLSACFQTAFYGIAWLAPLIVLYLLAASLCHSLCFVMLW